MFKFQQAEFLNYVRAQSARNKTTISWIKLEEDLILRFPILTRETKMWRPIGNPYFKTTERKVPSKSYLATPERNKINTSKILMKT